MTPLLLFAILITLLGAWPFVGNALVVVLLLLATAGVLIGLLLALGWLVSEPTVPVPQQTWDEYFASRSGEGIAAREEKA
jgi:hypothetical protein